MPRLSSWPCARVLLLASLLLASAPGAQPARSAPHHASSKHGWSHPWAAGTVVYGVVPSLFGKEPFKDVTARLPQLRELGVDTLWFSPINETVPGDFGYSVTSYFDLRSDYGTKEDFRELVRRAHELGMKVIMDFVPNHTAQEHPFFQDALKRGKASPYYGFYEWRAPGVPDYYFDWKHLPNLNYDNPVVDDMVLDALEFWVRDFDVDGYRVDVAWGVKQRDPKLWPQARTEIERVEPEVFLLAEASAKDPYFARHGFDAAYDWTTELGHWAWEKVWEEQAEIAPRLRNALADARKPGPGMVFRFLNNNDTGERFITRHGPELTRVAAVLLLTLPGIPCVYTGDEVGAAYKPYEDPPPLSWNDPHGLQPHYAKLIALRHRLASLRSRRFELLDVRPSTALAYLRTREDGREPVLVVLNFDARAAEVRLELPEKTARELGATLQDELSGDSLQATREAKALTVQLPAWGARVLTPGH
jgi:cyclomaltodextrinase / maltogenic alpha-amylase / neopullulanase